MESQLVTVFQFGIFVFMNFFSQEISGSPDELYKNETRLVVKFYLDFLCFYLCSV